MSIETLIDGVWLPQAPENNQRYRKYMSGYIVEEGIYSVIPEEDISREWRDKELINTDWVVAVTDHPQHAAYLVYRAALRDWPATSDFPDTKPELGA